MNHPNYTLKKKQFEVILELGRTSMLVGEISTLSVLNRDVHAPLYKSKFATGGKGGSFLKMARLH